MKHFNISLTFQQNLFYLLQWKPFRNDEKRLRQRKNLKDKKKILLNNDVIKNNADVIILITWLMLKLLLKSKDVLY